jgi:carbon starvation protein
MKLKRPFYLLLWILIGILGTVAYGLVAFHRGEPLNAVWLLAAAGCTYSIAYRFYSKWIAARIMALDDRRATPSMVHEDGKDFVRTNKWIVFGHHFAAISGPGPLVGPVLAAQFGYLPGTLWLLIGVVPGGAVQDFFIRPGRVLEVSALGIALLILSVWGGRWFYLSPSLSHYLDLSGPTLAWWIIGYGLAASILPVWLLLAPRDYLSTFMKLGTIAALAIGIVIVLPPLHLPPLTRFIDGTGPVFAGNVFPFCFITIACGAISGFHALIASGTTPKLITRESYARPVGYGSMLLESCVAIMAMIPASTSPSTRRPPPWGLPRISPSKRSRDGASRSRQTRWLRWRTPSARARCSAARAALPRWRWAWPGSSPPCWAGTRSWGSGTISPSCSRRSSY